MSKIKVVPASKEMLAKQLREALNDITVEDERIRLSALARADRPRVLRI